MNVINKLRRLCQHSFRKCYGFLVSFSFASCGKNFSPDPALKIRGAKNITIGDSFTTLGNAYLFANDGVLEIGNNLSLNTNVHIGASFGKIIIKNNVSIGPNVVLRSADHGTTHGTLINKQPHVGGSIIINDDVWIASNAVILKNVELGEGCVVAAGAVVTKDVPPYSIVGGIPAKVLRSRNCMTRE
jgi:galactoside O-acetyltransferase